MITAIETISPMIVMVNSDELGRTNLSSFNVVIILVIPFSAIRSPSSPDFMKALNRSQIITLDNL